MEIIRKRRHEPYARKRSVSSSVLVVTDSGSDWKSSSASTDSFDHKLQLIEAKKARFADTIFKAKQKIEDCNKFKAGFNIDDGSNVVKHVEKQPITVKKALSRKSPYEHTTMREGKKIADFKKDQDLKVSKKKLKAEKEKDCKRDDRCRRDYSRIGREVLENQRESARMALLEMENSVGNEDNIDVMREYVRLCGCLADSYETVFHVPKLESLDWFREPEKEDDRTAREAQVHSYNKKMDCKRDDDCHHDNSMITVKKALSRKRPYEHTTMREGKKIADYKKDQDLKVSKKKLKAEKEKDCKRSADRPRRDYSRIRREVLEKQRESAWMALLEMEKSGGTEENIDVMREYVRLCGCLSNSYETVFHVPKLESLDWFREPEKEDAKTAREDQVHSYNKKMDCKRDDDCHHDNSTISREAIEKQRESARMALLQTKKGVEIEDNIDVMAEYERLCGCDADSYGTVFHGIQLESLDWLLELEDREEREIFL